MKKILKKILSLGLVAVMLMLGVLLADKQCLRENVVRLHVVGASDTEEDQHLKLLVRDAVIAQLHTDVTAMESAKDSKAYLASQLSRLEVTAAQTLRKSGCQDTVTVTLKEEAFPVRHYDTFSLPSGVYNTLRIELGEAQGSNWWCVAFPAICIRATSEAFTDTAASSGFPDSLTGVLACVGGYEIEFFLLDCLGRLENLFV